MNADDRRLGMGRNITRRDFVQAAGLAALGLTLPLGSFGAPASGAGGYPPTRTGLRGSHPGSWEVAHALAREGKAFGAPEVSGERYDLVVVGGGISGLAAALYYQDREGPDARILILENHDDFGGHAKRNEFHQGGDLRLALGGVHNLEYTSFQDTVQPMLDRLGIDLDELKAKTGFNYGHEDRGREPGLWFDAEHYGRDVLMKGLSLDGASLAGQLDRIDDMPLSSDARARLKRFYAMDTHVLAGNSWREIEWTLRSVPYFDFLERYGGLSPECTALFNNSTHGGEGFSAVNLSAWEALDLDLPGWNLLGEGHPEDAFDYPMVMFPDGNASVARLMVQQLIPAVSPSANFHNIAVSRFDYGQLDRPEHPVRLRLNATVVGARNTPDGVSVRYVKGDALLGVKARHCVMACYHSILPHLCPEMPETQREAQAYQVKCPLLLTNVLLRNGDAVRASGLSLVRCPGRMHSRVMVWQGNTAGGYEQGSWDNEEGAMNLAFWGSIEEPPGDLTLKDRLRASRAKMLALDFEDYEREVRTVLDGVFGPFGLDVKEDVLAVTVNRWPHGYAYFYTDLWDPDFEPGSYPHEIARRPFGNITIANADAAADAYTHTAIHEACRAVAELPSV